jgi:8-oxo-dGTP diphosphatase
MRTRPVTPLIATDIIVELVDRKSRPIVLVERKNTPHGWALPGGFVDVGEEVETAAVREALEETGLDVWLQTLIGVYSDPSRDPRGHIISVVYTAIATGEPFADDDARTASVIEIDRLPSGLVFDHSRTTSASARAARPAARAPTRAARHPKSCSSSRARLASK